MPFPIDPMTAVAYLFAVFFALNIGASGTAAAMGAAYGAGAVKRRTAALLLVAVTASLGAIFSGDGVTETIGTGLIPADIIDVTRVLIILGSAGFTLFAANLRGVPLSTSEVAVGAVVGVGIAVGEVRLDKILLMVSFWALLPCIAFVVAAGLSKYTHYRIQPLFITKNSAKRLWIRRLSKAALLLSGCYEAFAAGSNNVANAVGPLVGAGVIPIHTAVLYGGLVLGVGALVMGHRVLETNAKKLTRLALLDGIIVSATGGTLVLIASAFGIPVPLTQTSTLAIVAVGWSRKGSKGVDQSTVAHVLQVWLLSPFISLFLSIGLVLLVSGYPLSIDSLGLSAAMIGLSIALLFIQSQSATTYIRRFL